MSSLADQLQAVQDVDCFPSEEETEIIIQLSGNSICKLAAYFARYGFLKGKGAS